jgi:Ca-activated chloride channel family protein
MKTNLTLDHSIVTVHHSDEIVHVMIDLEAPEAPPLQRAPLDVVVVLDRSGSMQGRPLHAVTSATAHLLRLAHPQDRLGVVAFDNEATTVLALGSHLPTVAASQVQSIRPGGSTNLSGGWLKAYEMLQMAPRPDAVRRIIVLTDGIVNAGITAPDQLGRVVARGRETGVTTSFIGFSTRYDEALLANLAVQGSGNNYFCEGPDQASAVFVDEFQGLASVVAQNISIEIRPTDAIASAGVLNEYPMIDLPNGGCQVEIGDAYGLECRRVVAGFHLRPLQQQGPVDIASIVIRWTSAIGNLEMHTVTIPVSITAGEPGMHDPGLDPRVLNEVFVLKTAKSRKDAHAMIQEGRLDEAADLLEQAIAGNESIPELRAEIDELRNEVHRLRSRHWNDMDQKMLKAKEWEGSRKRKAQYFDELERERRRAERPAEGDDLEGK